jgi:2-oxoglutarate ferredoxin oxidoreductase subunit delta
MKELAEDIKKTGAVKEPKKEEKEELEKVHVFEAWCKRCNICISFCPTGALVADKDGLPVLIPDKCTQCRLCELRCPDFAITVRPKEKKEENS